MTHKKTLKPGRARKQGWTGTFWYDLESFSSPLLQSRPHLPLRKRYALAVHICIVMFYCASCGPHLPRAEFNGRDFHIAIKDLPLQYFGFLHSKYIRHFILASFFFLCNCEIYPASQTGGSVDGAWFCQLEIELVLFVIGWPLVNDRSSHQSERRFC